MNKGRLLRLAEYLDTVDASKFDLASWAATYDDEEGMEEWIQEDELHTYVILDEDGAVQGYTRGHCNFKACAVGHATAIPEFREQGFGMIWNGSILAPRYQGANGWSAVQEFFDINIDQARKLFGGEGNDPRVVAEGIRKMVHA